MTKTEDCLKWKELWFLLFYWNEISRDVFPSPTPFLGPQWGLVLNAASNFKPILAMKLKMSVNNRPVSVKSYCKLEWATLDVFLQQFAHVIGKRVDCCYNTDNNSGYSCQSKIYHFRQWITSLTSCDYLAWLIRVCHLSCFWVYYAKYITWIDWRTFSKINWSQKKRKKNLDADLRSLCLSVLSRKWRLTPSNQDKSQIFPFSTNWEDFYHLHIKVNSFH